MSMQNTSRLTDVEKNNLLLKRRRRGEGQIRGMKLTHANYYT